MSYKTNDNPLIEIAASIISVILIFWFVLWLNSLSVDKCRKAFGPDAGYHGKFDMCIVGDQLKPLPAKYR